MNPLEVQQQIRNNSKEVSDYLTDLKSWGSKMEKKDKKSKPQQSDNNDDLPPLRNQAAAESTLKQNVWC